MWGVSLDSYTRMTPMREPSTATTFASKAGRGSSSCRRRSRTKSTSGAVPSCAQSGVVPENLAAPHPEQDPTPDRIGEGTDRLHQLMGSVFPNTALVLDKDRLVQFEHPC